MNYYTGRRSEGSGEIHIYIIRDGLLNIWEWDDRLSGGNTASKGRPEGSRNKKTIFQEVLEVDGEAIIEKIKGQALKANATAMRLCMERLLPVAQASNPQFWMPRVETAASLKEAGTSVTEAVSGGVLSPQEGEAVAKMLESQRRNIETVELEGRVKSLEEEIAKLGRDGK